jgi:transcriptional regulator with XRE-family HTH domain
MSWRRYLGVEYRLIDSNSVLKQLGANEVPSNIDMFYELSYKLSTYIFDYRMKHNLTQKEFAKMLGVRQPMVSKLENGNYNISLQNLCDVMAKLNTRIRLELEPEDDGMGTACFDVNAHEVPTVTIAKIEELGVAV